MNQDSSSMISEISADPAFGAVFKDTAVPHPTFGLNDREIVYSEEDRIPFALLARELVEAIVRNEPVRIFFDNDGTLFRFNPDPEETVIDRACYEALVRLAQFRNVLATSLTGRDVNEAAHKMLTPGYEVRDSSGRVLSAKGDKTLRFSITGSHGVENLDRSGHLTRFDFGDAAGRFIGRFQADAARLRDKYPGIHIEDGKHGSVGINVRTMEGPVSLKLEAYAEALSLLQHYENAAENPVLASTGKRVFSIRREGTQELELRPTGFGKDFGILNFGNPDPDALTLFLGDSFKQPDGTDLDAARIINDKSKFARGNVLLVRNGRFEPNLKDESVRPRLVFANPTMLGNFLLYVADKAEALAPRLGMVRDQAPRP